MRGLDRSEDGRDSGRVLEGSGKAAAILAPDAGRAFIAARAAERLRRVVHVRRQPRDRGVTRPDALCEQPPQLVDTLPRLRGDDQERRTADTVLGQEAPDVGAPGVNVTRGEEIGLVEDDRHRLRVRGERAQVAVVQRRICVLLRLHDPRDQVGEPNDAVDLEPVRRLDRVEVGEVEKDEAIEAVRREPVAARDLEPVEQRIGRASCRERVYSNV